MWAMMPILRTLLRSARSLRPTTGSARRFLLASATLRVSSRSSSRWRPQPLLASRSSLVGMFVMVFTTGARVGDQPVQGQVFARPERSPTGDPIGRSTDGGL